MSLYTNLAFEVIAALQRGDSCVANPHWSELSSWVTREAKRIHTSKAKLNHQNARDFISEASAHVLLNIPQFKPWYQKLAADGSLQDPFVPWCRTVLNNKYYDGVRKQCRDRKHLHELEQRANDTPGEAPLGAAPAAAATGDAPDPLDPVRLERIDPLDGVIVFALADCWNKLPPALWQGWLATLGLPPTFPPESVRSTPPRQRRQALADALGIDRNTLDKRLSRLRRNPRMKDDDSRR